jgi:hypothetical protein
MRLFGKKDKVVDWSEKYKIQAARNAKPVKSQSSETSGLGFLGDLASGSSASASDAVSWDNDSPASYSDETVGGYADKKQKLARRLLDMTGKIEDLNNQIYHLKQRIEVLEKKARITFE